MDEPRIEDSPMSQDDDEVDGMGDIDEGGMDVVDEDCYQLTHEEEQKRENDVEDMNCDLAAGSQNSHPDIFGRISSISLMMNESSKSNGRKLMDCAGSKALAEETLRLVESLSDLMKKIPRWRTYLKEIDDEHQAVLEALQAKEFNDNMSDLLEVMNLRERVKITESNISLHLRRVEEKHREISTILQDLCGRSQGDSTSVRDAIAPHKTSNLTKMSTDAEWEKDRKVINYIKGPPPLKPETLEYLGDKKIGDLSSFTQQQQIDLLDFCKSFRNAFESAQLLSRKKEGSTKWASEVSREQQGIIEDDAIQYVVPAMTADEVTAVQPYLLALQQSLADTVNSWGTGGNPQHQRIIESSPTKSRKVYHAPPLNRKSPFKTMFQINRPFPATERRPKRVVDQTFTAATARHVPLLWDDLIEFSNEEKPEGRASEKPEDCLQRGINQVLCAEAKHVWVGFNFNGVGLNTKATGIVQTPSYVKVIQLKLENVGTPDVKLTLYATDCLPLLPQNIFLKRVEGDPNEDWWKKNVKYPEKKSDTNEDGATLPSGLVLLAQIMASSRKDLLGPDQPILDVSDMVGYGTFSTIHRTREIDSVIKVSRYGALAAIQNESDVLKTIGDNPNIVKLKEEVCYKTFTVSDVTVSVPTITLSPFGRDVACILARNPNKTKEIIQKTASDIKKALDFTHSKDYTHNDVTPKNILANPTNDGQYEFFLINIGLATSINYEVKGFKGTTRFAHRALFGKYPNIVWPKTARIRFGYDFTSLAFSLADLSIVGTKRPWKHFQPSSSNSGLKEWADRRSEISWDKLCEFGFDEDEWKNRCYDG